MMRGKAAKNWTIGFAMISLCMIAVACGGNGASNNDQGVSVTFLGLFNSTQLSNNNNNNNSNNQVSGQQGCGQLPTVFTGGAIRLGEAEPEPAVTLTDTNSSGTDESGAFVSVIGIQNNLYGQAFRADRVLMDYYIPGASAQPPSTNAPVSLIAGPAESAAQITTNPNTNTVNPGLRKPTFTSLPPTFSNICNRALAQVTVIPAAIREWLNFNRDSLPEAPFKMEVTVRVSGLSSSGNRIDTNDGTFDFEVLPEVYISLPEAEPTVVPTAAASTFDAVGNDGSDLGHLEAPFELEGLTEAEG